jgi:uncharacterized RDD family membrane protein YckC
LEKRISILTPEAVEFDFLLADIGSRFIAILIDTIIQMIISLPVIILIYIIRAFWWFSDIPDSISPWIIAILLLLLFIVGFSGYHIIFDIIWNGRTPGKLITGIKVICDSGYPVTISSSFIRNLIRIIDFLPFYYSTGIISIVMTKNKKRIGDIVGGTIVIKEYSDIMPPVLEKKPLVNKVILNLDKITDKEFLLIREFLLRQNQMDIKSRDNIAQKIALPLIKKLEYPENQLKNGYINFIDELFQSINEKKKVL